MEGETSLLAKWLEAQGLESIFDGIVAAGVENPAELLELTISDLKELGDSLGLNLLTRRRFIRAAQALNPSLREEDEKEVSIGAAMGSEERKTVNDIKDYLKRAKEARRTLGEAEAVVQQSVTKAEKTIEEQFQELIDVLENQRDEALRKISVEKDRVLSQLEKAMKSTEEALENCEKANSDCVEASQILDPSKYKDRKKKLLAAAKLAMSQVIVTCSTKSGLSVTIHNDVLKLKDKTAQGFVKVEGNIWIYDSDVPGAGGHKWGLSMSSQYGGLPNNYETLTDNRYGWPGAATNSGGLQFIQASFDAPVAVSRIRLSSSYYGVFKDQGWSGDYQSNTDIEYSADKSNWTVAMKITAGVAADGLTDFVLPKGPIVAQYWRLKRMNSYIAIGNFILE